MSLEGCSKIDLAWNFILPFKVLVDVTGFRRKWILCSGSDVIDSNVEQELLSEAETAWAQREWSIQHVLFPSMRLFFKPPASMATNGTFVKVMCVILNFNYRSGSIVLLRITYATSNWVSVFCCVKHQIILPHCVSLKLHTFIYVAYKLSSLNLPICGMSH
jgi:hypothetical protein